MIFYEKPVEFTIDIHRSLVSAAMNLLEFQMLKDVETGLRAMGDVVWRTFCYFSNAELEAAIQEAAMRKTDMVRLTATKKSRSAAVDEHLSALYENDATDEVAN